MTKGCGMRRAVFYVQMPVGIFVHKIPKPKYAEQMPPKDILLTAPNKKILDALCSSYKKISTKKVPNKWRLFYKEF
jgi:hypothetical protein